MAQLVVRNLDEDVKERLRQRAAANGNSMEAEVRLILRTALVDEVEPEIGLGTQIAALFRDCGLREPLPIPPDEEPEPALFSK